MSGPLYQQPSNYASPFHPHPSRDDVKATYDDLIDGYSSHPTSDQQFQSFGNAPHRAPSTTLGQLGQKSSFSTKHSTDTSLDLSYPPKPAAQDSDAPGLWQKILPESLACRFYVITVLIETTIDLAIEGELLLRVRREATNDDQITSRKMPVYLSIFALAHVFQFVMAVDAVYARNTLQFIFLTIFNALFLIYAIIQIREVQEAITDVSSKSGVADIPIGVLTTIIPIVISIAEVAYIGLGWKIYHEFGWKVYKFLGADRRIKQMYATYQIYECLVKFDVFFWAAFSVQFIWLVLQSSDSEYYVTCAALPLSIVLLVEGHLAARHENKWMMATFMSGCVGAMVYFIFKFIKVLILKDQEQFRLVWKSLAVFSFFSIILLLATFTYSVLVLRNFGRGLKDALTRKKISQHNRFNSTNRLATTMNPNRMTID
ncbi:hypothetical protein BDN72DRAFT_890654 [Pluteus cervinus]|uniref:Uncharacterized protein n=1 Tax=Pluteus cervinus TaxID=181527 RepID=A0ACD3BGA5_9AGAR|nr:hypothetical protein BDN72DRAFT_890654 [Pluteus cervinus]